MKGARTGDRRVAHVVWVSVHGDGTRRDEDEPQDGIFEGIRFSPEADLPPVGDRRRWFARQRVNRQCTRAEESPH